MPVFHAALVSSIGPWAVVLPCIYIRAASLQDGPVLIFATPIHGTSLDIIGELKARLGVLGLLVCALDGDRCYLSL